METQEKAYGDEHIKPKPHVSRHLPAQFLRDSTVLDTLVVERKHKRVKTIIDPLSVGVGFEQAILNRLVSY